MLKGHARRTANVRTFLDIFVDELVEKVLKDELGSVTGSGFVLGGDFVVMVSPASDLLLFDLLGVFLEADLGGLNGFDEAFDEAFRAGGGGGGGIKSSSSSSFEDRDDASDASDSLLCFFLVVFLCPTLRFTWYFPRTSWSYCS